MKEPKNENKPKIIVILGPTATGKSDLGVRLAKKFNGEIVSADSRQVYTGLDIGSGKITKKEMLGIPHYLLDVISPINKKRKELQKPFSVVNYQKKAYKAIDKILTKNKIPILVGGTAFYIQSIVDGIVLPEVAANPTLRLQLEKEPIEKLQRKLKKLDPKRYSEIDIKNKVRLIRAIEIATTLGSVPKTKAKPKYNCLQIGLKLPTEKLHENIVKRLTKRMSQGMLEEARLLHQKGLSWKKMEALGLEYRYQAQYLQNKITKEKMLEKILNKSHQFAKRQMTWFKRDPRINWFDSNKKDMKKIEKTIFDFL